MERLPREAGPVPTTKRVQRRRGLVALRGCMCPECRTAIPARQEAWERHIRDVKRSIGKKEL